METTTTKQNTQKAFVKATIRLAFISTEKYWKTIRHICTWFMDLARTIHWYIYIWRKNLGHQSESNKETESHTGFKTGDETGRAGFVLSGLPTAMKALAPPSIIQPHITPEQSWNRLKPNRHLVFFQTGVYFRGTCNSQVRLVSPVVRQPFWPVRQLTGLVGVSVGVKSR